MIPGDFFPEEPAPFPEYTGFHGTTRYISNKQAYIS